MEKEIINTPSSPSSSNNISKINTNNFYTLFLNMKKAQKLINSFKKFINEYFEALYAYYIRINEVNGHFSLEDKFKSSIIKSPVFRLGKITKNMLETHINNLNPLVSGDTLFREFENSLTNISNILEESSINLDKKRIEQNVQPIAVSLEQKYEEIESTIIDDYIFKKYNKHLDILINEPLENNIEQAKYLEKTFLDLEEVSNIQFFKSLKEMENKTLNTYNEMIKIVNKFIETIKDKGTEFFNILNEGKNEIKQLIGNEDINNKENKENKKEKVSSKEKSELKNIIDLDNYKYKIKILEYPYVNVKIEDKNDKKVKDKKGKNKEDNNKNNKIKKEEILYDKELLLTDEDIYNIISKIYSYDLKFINKSKYKLDIENRKLQVKHLTEKLLTFDVENSTNEIITEEEVNKLYELLLNNKDNMLKFLFILNNYRATGRCEMKEREFKIIEKIFNICQDYMIKNGNSELDELILILSQTFYIMKKEEKIYLQQIIRNHDLFKKEEFWKNHLKNIINEDISKIEKEEKEGKLEYSKEIKERKIKQLIMAKIIPFTNNMIEFGASKEMILNIINPIMDKYNLDENSRIMSLSLLEQIK